MHLQRSKEIENIFRISVLFLVIFLSGCSGGQIKGDFSNVTYIRQKIASLDMPVELYLSRFTLGNEIMDPYLLGEGKTGMFNSKGKVISDIPIPDIFFNAFRAIFKEAGFIMTEDMNVADLIVTGEIQQFWVEEYASGWTPEYAKATVRYDLVLKDTKGNVFWAKSIDVEQKSTSFGSFFDATGSLLPTLKKALFMSTDQIINDSLFKSNLNELIENKKRTKNGRSEMS